MSSEAVPSVAEMLPPDQRRAGRSLVAASLLVPAVLIVYHAFGTTSLAYRPEPPVTPHPNVVEVEPEVAAASPWSAPLAKTWLALERRVHGPAPLGYHVTGLVLFSIALLLVHGVARELRIVGASDPRARPALYGAPAAVLAALLVATHPACVELLAWTEQRGVLLALVLGLAATLLYLRAGAGLVLLVVALVFLAAALAASPMVAGLPLVFLLLGVFSRRPRRCGAAGMLAIHTLYVALAVLAFWSNARRAPLPGVAPGSDWLQVAAAPGEALLRVFWPVELVPRDELGLKFTPSWRAWAYAGVTLGMTLAGALSLRRLPGLGVALLAAVAMALPGALLYGGAGLPDRVAVFVLVPLALAVAGVVQAPLGRQPARAVVVIPVLVFGVGAAGVLGFLAAQQIEVWRTPLSLWTHTVNSAQRSDYATYRLARESHRSGEVARAAQLYRVYLRDSTAPPDASVYLARALRELDEPDYERALEAVDGALRRYPDCAVLHFERGFMLACLGEYHLASVALQAAVRLAPDQAQYHATLGRVQMWAGQTVEARQNLETAIQQAPDVAEFRQDLSRAATQPAVWPPLPRSANAH